VRNNAGRRIALLAVLLAASLWVTVRARAEYGPKSLPWVVQYESPLGGLMAAEGATVTAYMDDFPWLTLASGTTNGQGRVTLGWTDGGGYHAHVYVSWQGQGVSSNQTYLSGTPHVGDGETIFYNNQPDYCRWIYIPPR